MWVTCTQAALLKGVQLASRAISTRTTMPILGYILLETMKNGLKLTATDLELAVQVEIDAEVKQGGQITLPARILTEIVGNLPDATVELKGAETGPQVQIKCEASDFEILGLPAGNFPTQPKPEGNEIGAIEADVRRRLVSKTIFAVSSVDIRPFLTGLYVTAKTMQLVTPALAGVTGEVQLAMADNQLLFAVPGLRVFSRLITGQFPNYQQVIPQEFKQRIRVKTERLLRAVRRMSITARDSANVVRLAAKGQQLTITSNTPEVGKGRGGGEVTPDGDT